MENEISECKSIITKAISRPLLSNDLIVLAYLRCNNGVSYEETFKKNLSEKIKHKEEKEQALKAKARAEADEKRAAYWKAHADEKSALDEKKSVAESRKTVLTAEMEQIPELLQVKNMQTQIDELSKQISPSLKSIKLRILSLYHVHYLLYSKFSIVLHNYRVKNAL